MGPERHPQDGWTLADPCPMGPRTRAALRGLIRVLCPPPPGPTLPDLEDRVENHVRRMLQYMPPPLVVGFAIAVHVVDWAPLWRFVAPRRMQHLDRDRAERLLGQMSESRFAFIRKMILAIRGIVLSTFYDQDEVHLAMGWEPLPFLTQRIELRQGLLP